MEIKVEKGSDSWAEGHGTRYWHLSFKNVRRKIKHHVAHYSNDFKHSKKYHCYIDYGGCIGYRTFDTDSIHEAFNWMKEKLNKYL